MITSKQRAALRSLANGIETIMQVGKAGIIGSTTVQVENALEARELIKLRVLETCPVSAREAAATLAESTGADIVQVIGTRFVLYKRSKENPKIEI